MRMILCWKAINDALATWSLWSFRTQLASVEKIDRRS